MPIFLRRVTLLLASLSLAAVGAGARGQGLPPPPSDEEGSTASPTGGPAAFDVISIHEHASDDHMMRWMHQPNGLSTVNIPLQSLIASAYDIKMYLISGGPSWVNTKGFDVEAKVLPGDGPAQAPLTSAQNKALLLAMLKDRFHLSAHVESKTLPVYDLVVAKTGLRMQLAPPPPPPSDDKATPAKGRGGMSFSPGHLEANAYAISLLAQQLGYIVQRTVIDKTGLIGEYNFSLSWTPEEQLGAASDVATTGTEARPSIYAAIGEQLGLKLLPSKGPVDTLVIDHVELPTAN